MLKIRKYEIINISFIFVLSLIFLNNIYAQTPDETKINSEVGADRNTDTNVNTRETVSDADVVDSIKTVSETIDEVKEEAVRVESEIRDTVKSGIDRNIIDIRKSTEKPAHELQSIIDEDRTNIFDNLNKTLNNLRLDSTENVNNLADQIDERVSSIQEKLQAESGVEIDFTEEKRSIRNTLLKFKDETEERRSLIIDRGGDLVYKDSDDDGVSDYDEIYIYKTDPNKSKTVDGELNDGEKIQAGINPTSEKEEKINYEDPREDQVAYVSTSYKLDSVAVVKEEDRKTVLFVGQAIPNSYITLYIYSTPVIVTVKTDDNGDWSYELDKELENGDHELYVATVSNSGKIVARSTSIPFTKTADAASIGIIGIDVQNAKSSDFFRDNFILISLAILIAGVILTMMFIGNNKNAVDIAGNLRKELDNPENKN